VKRLTILFALFILFIIVLADTGNLWRLDFLNRIPCGDKAGHFLLYGILTLLLDLTLLRSKRFGLRPNLLVLRVALTLALLIGIEEYSQQFFAKRTFDLVDLAFSYLGVAFFSWAALRVRRTGRVNESH
jgi:VanZ family protein